MSNNQNFDKIMEIYESNQGSNSMSIMRRYRADRIKHRKEKFLKSIETIKENNIEESDISLFEREVNKKIKFKKNRIRIIEIIINFIIVIFITAIVGWLFVGSEELELHVNEKRMEVQNQIISELEKDSKNKDELEKINEELNKVNKEETIEQKEKIMDDLFISNPKYKSFKVYENYYSRQFSSKLEMVKYLLIISAFLLCISLLRWYFLNKYIKKLEDVLSFYDNIRTQIDKK